MSELAWKSVSAPLLLWLSWSSQEQGNTLLLKSLHSIKPTESSTTAIAAASDSKSIADNTVLQGPFLRAAGRTSETRCHRSYKRHMMHGLRLKKAQYLKRKEEEQRAGSWPRGAITSTVTLIIQFIRLYEEEQLISALAPGRWDWAVQGDWGEGAGLMTACLKGERWLCVRED